MADASSQEAASGDIRDLLKRAADNALRRRPPPTPLGVSRKLHLPCDVRSRLSHFGLGSLAFTADDIARQRLLAPKAVRAGVPVFGGNPSDRFGASPPLGNSPDGGDDIARDDRAGSSVAVPLLSHSGRRALQTLSLAQIAGTGTSGGLHSGAATTALLSCGAGHLAASLAADHIKTFFVDDLCQAGAGARAFFSRKSTRAQTDDESPPGGGVGDTVYEPAEPCVSICARRCDAFAFAGGSGGRRTRFTAASFVGDSATVALGVAGMSALWLADLEALDEDDPAATMTAIPLGVASSDSNAQSCGADGVHVGAIDAIATDASTPSQHRDVVVVATSGGFVGGVDPRCAGAQRSGGASRNFAWIAQHAGSSSSSLATFGASRAVAAVATSVAIASWNPCVVASGTSAGVVRLWDMRGAASASSARASAAGLVAVCDGAVLSPALGGGGSAAASPIVQVSPSARPNCFWVGSASGGVGEVMFGSNGAVAVVSRVAGSKHEAAAASVHAMLASRRVVTSRSFEGGRFAPFVDAGDGGVFLPDPLGRRVQLAVWPTAPSARRERIATEGVPVSTLVCPAASFGKAQPLKRGTEFVTAKRFEIDRGDGGSSSSDEDPDNKDENGRTSASVEAGPVFARRIPFATTFGTPLCCHWIGCGSPGTGVLLVGTAEGSLEVVEPFRES